MDCHDGFQLSQMVTNVVFLLKIFFAEIHYFTARFSYKQTPHLLDIMILIGFNTVYQKKFIACILIF